MIGVDRRTKNCKESAQAELKTPVFSASQGGSLTDDPVLTRWFGVASGENVGARGAGRPGRAGLGYYAPTAQTLEPRCRRKLAASQYGV